MARIRKLQIEDNATQDKVGRLGKQTLAEQAYQQIRNEILRGDLTLGAILSRRKLAEELNMSFLPITEALQRLETDGLVESQPRIGTRVKIPTAEDVLGNFIVREALEAQAARMCCQNMSATERKLLQKSAKDLDRLYKTGSSKLDSPAFLFSVHTLHVEFHLQIAKLAHSPKLLRSIEREQVLVFNLLYDTAAHRSVLPANFHGQLAKAICTGDPLHADAAMREHVRYGLEDVLKSLAHLEVESGWRHRRGT